jgi:hypothetical protein
VNVAVGRKEVHQNPLLDHGEGGALSGKGLVGPELQEEVPPVPVEVPVDRGIVMTTLLFTEDLHRQHLDVGQLWTALPQPTAERHRPVAIIDEQIQQDQRFFQAHGRVLKTP